MAQAAAENDVVVTSLFVNPTQFGPKEDFSKYPRDEATDAQLAQQAGTHILFAPTVEEMYPNGLITIRVAKVSEPFEGLVRPGHFDGVATVVAKLLIASQPTRAYFGLKDLQQCAVVHSLVSDMLLPVELRFHEIVREESGLAQSSRNEYLTGPGRKVAASIYSTLVHVKDQILSGTESETAMQTGIAQLNDAGFLVDYLELVDSRTMESVRRTSQFTRLVVCARLEGVRLLDNISCG